MNPMNSNWQNYQYTDGFGNTYDLQRRNVDGKSEYQWCDTVYSCWDDLAKDMAYSVSHQPKSESSLDSDYKAKPGDYSIFDSGLNCTWTLDGKTNKNNTFTGQTLDLRLGALDKDAYGLTLKYTF